MRTWPKKCRDMKEKSLKINRNGVPKSAQTRIKVMVNIQSLIPTSLFFCEKMWGWMRLCIFTITFILPVYIFHIKMGPRVPIFTWHRCNSAKCPSKKGTSWTLCTSVKCLPSVKSVPRCKVVTRLWNFSLAKPDSARLVKLVKQLSTHLTHQLLVLLSGQHLKNV